jgi:hypothetical protein
MATNCWIEIDTGAGDYSKVQDFGQLLIGSQNLLILLGVPTLLKDLNGKSAIDASQNCRTAMNDLRTNINTIASPQQVNDFEPLLKYLDAIHDAGIQHPGCVFRCITGT